MLASFAEFERMRIREPIAEAKPAISASTISWRGARAESRAIWLHYGANLGAGGGALSVMSVSDDLRALATAELSRAGQKPDRIVPKDAVPSGETRDIHRAGGRYITLVGSNPWFHLPADR